MFDLTESWAGDRGQYLCRRKQWPLPAVQKRPVAQSLLPVQKRKTSSKEHRQEFTPRRTPARCLHFEHMLSRAFCRRLPGG
jgi:hypothetical protein